MSARRKHSEAMAPAKKKPAAARSPAPEAYEHYDDVGAEAVKSVQDRANKILKKGKWVVVDGYVDKQ